MDGRRAAGAALVTLGAAMILLSSFQLVAGSGSRTPEATPAASPGPGSIEPPVVSPSGAESSSSSPFPSPTRAATPTPAPTPEPSPTLSAQDDAAIRAFLGDLVTAIRGGTVASLASRLNGAVIDRYGLAQCQTSLAAGKADPGYAIEVNRIEPPAAWDYITDDRTTPIPAAWTIEAQVTAAGTTASRQIHLAPVDGVVSWFSDCGDPLPSP